MLELLKDPVFIVFASLTLVFSIHTIAYYWWKTRRDELEAALRQDMLQRGMSADEIVQVLRLSKPCAHKERLAEQAPARESYRR
jgi:hypothetical protein